MKKALLSLVIPVLLGLGCYTDDSTVRLDTLETDGQITEECVTELNDYMLGNDVDELTDCLLDVFVETSDIKDNTYLTLVTTEEGDDYMDNVSSVPIDGLCQDGPNNYLYMRDDMNISYILEVFWHENGHLDRDPIPTDIGNHLKAELHPTIGSLKLAELLYQHNDTFDENEFVPSLPFMITLPIKLSSHLQDNENTEYDESQDTFLLGDAINDKSLGAWKFNYDFVLAESAINLKFIEYNGDFEKVEEAMADSNYKTEYDFVADTYEGLEDNILYELLIDDREKAQSAILDYVETTDYAPMAQYAYWSEYY